MTKLVMKPFESEAEIEDETRVCLSTLLIIFQMF